MSGNESNGKEAANGSDQEDGSGSDFPINTPSPESNGNTFAEDETTDGMSEVQDSEAAAACRKDEYDVDFE
jgi:hypothetical protein